MRTKEDCINLRQLCQSIDVRYSVQVSVYRQRRLAGRGRPRTGESLEQRSTADKATFERMAVLDVYGYGVQAAFGECSAGAFKIALSCASAELLRHNEACMFLQHAEQTVLFIMLELVEARMNGR